MKPAITQRIAEMKRRADGEIPRDQQNRLMRPIALYRCENCKRNKWLKKDWLLPERLICIICGAVTRPKIIKPHDYDVIRAEQKAHEESIGWTGYGAAGTGTVEESAEL